MNLKMKSKATTLAALAQAVAAAEAVY